MTTDSNVNVSVDMASVLKTTPLPNIDSMPINEDIATSMRPSSPTGSTYSSRYRAVMDLGPNNKFGITPVEKSDFIDNWLATKRLPNFLELSETRDDSSSDFASSSSSHMDSDFPRMKPFLNMNSYSSFGENLSSVSNSTSTLYHNRWPVPTSVEQIEQMCEQEKKNGTSKSQLALCLHLMETAWQADGSKPPSPNTSSKIFGGFKSGKKNVGEAMISAARSMLKHLAKSSQRIGRGGEAEAQYLLGNCYGMGALGWPINHQLAFQWYTQASKQDHPEGTYRTAVCYELGLGTSKDGARALIFYKKAAVLRHVPSMYKLGIIYMRGYYGQAVSKREAVTWLQRATGGTGSNKNNKTLPHALHALALIQLSGECGETSLISDTNYAMKLLHDAANMGYAPSQTKLGECYECGHFCPVDEGQSLYWYTQAAKQDYPEAALALSGWYLTGSLKTQNLPQSDTEAYLWARRAVTLIRQQHQTKSVAGKIYYALGVYHENGIGVKKSAGNAMKWYRRAASAGHLGAYKLISSY